MPILNWDHYDDCPHVFPAICKGDPMRTKLNKIKLFKDSSISKLEKTINSWLEKNKYIEIVQILQSETVINNSPDAKNGNFSRTISICYKELEEPSSVIPEPVTQNKLSRKNDEFELLNKQLKDFDVNVS